MRTALLVLCSVAIAFAQKGPPDARQILETTAHKYDELTSYESSAMSSRPLGAGLTFRVQLLLGYAGPTITPASLPVPMIPPVTQMKFLGVFDESGKSVGTKQSLVGPSLPAFDQIASWVAKATLLNTEIVNKHPCDIVEVQYEVTSRNPHYAPTRYWIDQSSKTVWKMQFSESDGSSKPYELTRWTVVWDAWTENQAPPSWLLDAAKRMSAKQRTTLTGKHAPGITGRALDGSPFDLSKLKGSIVVLDNSGGGKGPQLKTNARSNEGPRDWR